MLRTASVRAQALDREKQHVEIHAAKSPFFLIQSNLHVRPPLVSNQLS